MSLIRAQQRTITGLFPHNANRRFLIRNTRAGPEIRGTVWATTTATIIFDEPVGGGNETGFQLTIDGAPTAIVSVANGLATEIVVTYAIQLVGARGVITYIPKGTADWVGLNSGVLVKGFQQFGDIA